jgi:probable phosphoglycerate mutase
MARILLIRHAPTPETGSRLTGRAGGVSLGTKGEVIAARTAERVAKVKLAAVYTSPIERTAETADIVAAPHGLTPIVEAGVIEIDFGRWTGRTLKSLRQTNLWSQVQRVPSRVTFPDGESFVDAQHRAVAAVDRIAATIGNATAVVVSHSDVIKLVISHHLGQSIDLFQRIAVSPASISILHLPKEGPPVVETVNSHSEVSA